jgi:hypothetical protein
MLDSMDWNEGTTICANFEDDGMRAKKMILKDGS